jgi:hypothetical protein
MFNVTLFYQNVVTHQFFFKSRPSSFIFCSFLHITYLTNLLIQMRPILYPEQVQLIRRKKEQKEIDMEAQKRESQYIISVSFKKCQ